jgi:hypothetical protein
VLQVQALESFKSSFGADHPKTLSNMNNLALTYGRQGRWKEAEELQTEELATCKQIFGVNHPSTLISMNNLTYTWKASGRAVEAIMLMQDCVERQNQALGLEHPDALRSCSLLEEWEQEVAQGANVILSGQYVGSV